MSDDPSDQQDVPSVFGNLPRTRPGARSPRRDEAAARRSTNAKRAEETTAPSPEADAESVLAESRAASGPEDPAPEPPATDEEGGGIEELAWAGVAAAAEAATLGVRLANRALESLRGGSEEH